MRVKRLILLLLALAVPSALADDASDPLFASFQQPPAPLRPFVRWWWNGSRVTEAEILRELDALKAAGVGGVEINTIAMRDDVPKEGLAAFPERPWLGPEWCAAVKAAAEGARARGMTADIIVGSGWPFGGRFLQPGEQTKRVRLVKKELNGPTTFVASLAELAAEGRKEREDVEVPARLVFLRLVPAGGRDFMPGQELAPAALRGGRVRVAVPVGAHVLHVGLLETGFTHVKLGAPGADGPVVDHWSVPAVRRYLEHMSSGLAPALGGRLGETQGGPLRASFVDSLELDHANWTDDLAAEFARRRGYDLAPYLPFVLDRDDPTDDSPRADVVRRARYDFHRTVVELFHDRFLLTYVGWAHENGLLARMQAYGRETHPLEGGMQVDLPEGESWLWSDHDRIAVVPTVADKYVSSAAHLAGRGPVSFEAMTNAVPVFREMPEDFKLEMDLSALTGVLQPVLHGFNYSPREAGFPGWVRFGSWFNEQNPWWPHVRRFTDYAARLTTVLSSSEFQASVALLGPKADEWARDGLLYQPFPEVSRPWYHYHLWQALQQAGYGTDFVSEGVLRDARVEDGRLRYGMRAYGALVVMDVTSLEPETADAIARFGEGGGRVVFVGRAPDRAPGLKGTAEADRRVRETIARLLGSHGEQAAVVPAPSQGLLPPGDYTRGALPDGARRELLRWVLATMPRLGAGPDVAVAALHEDVGLVHHRSGERDIFFFANASRTEAREVEARFPTSERRPWRWDLETGTRAPMPFAGRPDTLTLHLQPLESVLIVYDPVILRDGRQPGPEGSTIAPVDPSHAEPNARAQGDAAVALRLGKEWLPVVAPWDVELRPAGGTPFRRHFPQLFDLSLAADDPEVAGFGGVALYRAEFEWTDESRTLLGLGTVHGVSGVRLNGKDLGTRWWGRHLYDAKGALQKGRNVLEVEVTTTLGNRMRSLKDNPVAKSWSWWFPPIAMGLVGPVQLMKPAS
jgi:glycosyl hydrolase family 106( putative alpha-L-rhamnosidase)